jgi:hypothetical protein
VWAVPGQNCVILPGTRTAVPPPGDRRLVKTVFENYALLDLQGPPPYSRMSRHTSGRARRGWGTAGSLVGAAGGARASRRRGRQRPGGCDREQAHRALLGVTPNVGSQQCHDCQAPTRANPPLGGQYHRQPCTSLGGGLGHGARPRARWGHATGGACAIRSEKCT